MQSFETQARKFPTGVNNSRGKRISVGKVLLEVAFQHAVKGFLEHLL